MEILRVWLVVEAERGRLHRELGTGARERTQLGLEPTREQRRLVAEDQDGEMEEREASVGVHEAATERAWGG